jgi:predicted kinase
MARFSIPYGLRPSAIPVVLVAGPPASGKTTYVRQHAELGDVVIDFDDCLARAGARKWTDRQSEKEHAFYLRDRLFHSLATSTAPKAWAIVSAPSERERAAWLEVLGPKASWVVLDVPAEECKRRVLQEADRAHAVAAMNASIDRWWREAVPRNEIQIW